MEPLFTTETSNTLDEYKKYHEAVMKRIKPHYKRNNVISVLLMLLCTLIFLVVGKYKYAIIWLISVVGVTVTTTKNVNKEIKKSWESYYATSGTTVKFAFFEDRIEIKDSNCSAVFPYEKFYDLIETETNMYLMTAERMGYIIMKVNCSRELTDYLRAKLGKDYKVSTAF